VNKESLDLKLVWGAVTQRIPAVKPLIQQILAEHSQ